MLVADYLLRSAVLLSLHVEATWVKGDLGVISGKRDVFPLSLHPTCSCAAVESMVQTNLNERAERVPRRQAGGRALPVVRLRGCGASHPADTHQMSMSMGNAVQTMAQI